MEGRPANSLCTKDSNPIQSVQGKHKKLDELTTRGKTESHYCMVVGVEEEDEVDDEEVEEDELEGLVGTGVDVDDEEMDDEHEQELHEVACSFVCLEAAAINSAGASRYYLRMRNGNGEEMEGVGGGYLFEDYSVGRICAIWISEERKHSFNHYEVVT